MEYTTFAKNGQWTLHKASTTYMEPPKSADKPGNKQFNSYGTATAEGRLTEDHGQRGMLHDFGGGKRPKPAGLKGVRTWGQVPHKVDSVYEDRNPGAGE